MTKIEFEEYVKKIIETDYAFGLSVYACIKNTDDEKQLKKFIVTDDLQFSLKNRLVSMIYSTFLDPDVELDAIENISDNRKALYEANLTEDFNPTSFIDNAKIVTEQYDGKDRNHLLGFCYKLNYNTDCIWLYQHMYSMAIVGRSKSLLAIIGKDNVYEPLNKDVVSFASNLDMMIIGDKLFTSKIKLLQQQFGFETYIRNEAANTVDYIINMNLITNAEKLLAFTGKEKLTNAKKMMKAQRSPVLQMEKNALISQIKRHARYSKLIKIENDKIVTDTEKDVNAFIKMLNDDIVRSDLTNVEYDSSAKKALEPRAI